MRKNDRNARSLFEPGSATPDAKPTRPAGESANYGALGSQQVYPAGFPLFVQGAHVQEVVGIEYGLVKLACASESGRELIIGVYGPGWMLGMAAAILQRPAPATAVTLTRCSVWRIPVENLRRRIEQSDDFSKLLLQMASREAYEQIHCHVAMGLSTARERLEQVFRECLSTVNPTVGEVPLPLPLRQWELAALIAVAPEHLSRILREMEREGLIRRYKGRVIIVDPQRLRRESEL
ncbi:MAG: Crp/Fnr family transcriptional regulator [Acidobacteriota bacterium]|nr:Crp/Fnr family transcriptional regulator [Acidobacteriota bacterium]